MRKHGPIYRWFTYKNGWFSHGIQRIPPKGLEDLAGNHGEIYQQHPGSRFSTFGDPYINLCIYTYVHITCTYIYIYTHTCTYRIHPMTTGCTSVALEPRLLLAYRMIASPRLRTSGTLVWQPFQVSSPCQIWKGKCVIFIITTFP